MNASSASLNNFERANSSKKILKIFFKNLNVFSGETGLY